MDHMLLSSIGQALADFMWDESGIAQLEYALIGALLSVATIMALTTNGQVLTELFDLVAHETEPPPPVLKTSGP